MKKTLLLLIVFSYVLNFCNAQPTGIYVLDNNQGTYRDANIRDYSFVDGFVWRTSWAEIETSIGVYDFAGIDHIVTKLDSINKKLTILFGGYTVEPTYIALDSNTTTYSFINPINNVTTQRAVPYDSLLLQRFRLLLSQLANHQIYSLTSGTMVALKNHPVLSNIATNIPGLGAIRNVNSLNLSIENVFPNYDRNKFVDSLITSLKIQTDNFPTKNIFIPFYKDISDNTSTPSLETFVKSELLVNFNGIQNPKISFWQENLAGFTDTLTNSFTGFPTTTYATPLLGLGNSAYTMFQMLQGWTTPFLDPAKTANSTPFDAMCYAYNTFGASYYEIYVSDVDNINYQSSFNSWDTLTCNLTLTTSNQNAIPILSIYPNPVVSQLSISGITNFEKVNISITNLSGQNIITAEHTKIIDVSVLSSGIYLIKIDQPNTEPIYMKFIKK